MKFVNEKLTEHQKLGIKLLGISAILGILSVGAFLLGAGEVIYEALFGCFALSFSTGMISATWETIGVNIYY
ncbi:MAG: hypothetical protein NTU58_01265 [Candidatus Nealsonbacteria bacterium]|nr:hypothetical protein [Candidatus Nealsonbacteria bacterium]